MNSEVKRRIVRVLSPVMLAGALVTISAPLAHATPTPTISIDPGDPTSYVASGSTVSKLNLNPGNTSIQGNATGITTGVDSAANNAPYLAFNGNSYATFPTYDFGTQFTLVAWVKPRHKASINTIIANASAWPGTPNSGFKFTWNNWNTSGQSDHAIIIEAGNPSGVGGKPSTPAEQVVEGDWQQVAYSVDLKNGVDTPTVNLYRNGSQQCLSGSMPVNVGHNQTWNIGAMIGGSYGMNALLGQFHIYSSNLSQADIISDFDSTKATYGVTANAVLASAPPSNFELPVVTGTAAVGQTLTSGTGSWYNSCSIAYTYKWASSATYNGSYTDISGATSSSYTTVSGDAAQWLRVAVTGTTGQGNSTVYQYVQMPGAPAAPSLPVITSPTSNSAINGTEGTSFSSTVAVTGGTAPDTVTVSSGTLPPGLSIDASGNITGTPTTPGTYTVDFTVTDSLGNTASVTSISFIIAAAGGGSPAPAPVSIPDPAQTSQINAAVWVCKQNTNTLDIQGRFDATIKNIFVNSKAIDATAWIQTPTDLFIGGKYLADGNSAIQIFNGQAPVLPVQMITFSNACAVAAPAPAPVAPAPVVDTPTTPAPEKPMDMPAPVAPKMTQAPIPFPYAKADVGSVQMAIIKSLHLPSQGSVALIGYASNTAGEDDVRISLDRALNVKSAILKLRPNLKVVVMGAGITKTKVCGTISNQCTVVKVLKANA